MTSIPPTDPDLLAAARRFAAEAGALTLEWFRGGDLDLEHKGDGTPVTAADKAAESRLRMRIGEFAPDDAILGEEEGATEGTSGRRWVVDPIDGTKAFTRGVPLYSTLVAVEDEHGPAVGVIELPALGQQVFAGRGLGCFVADANGERPAGQRDRLAGRCDADDQRFRFVEYRSGDSCAPLGGHAAHLGRWLRLCPGSHRLGGCHDRPHRC